MRTVTVTPKTTSVTVSEVVKNVQVTAPNQPTVTITDSGVTVDVTKKVTNVEIVKKEILVNVNATATKVIEVSNGPGAPGINNYQLAVINGFVGTEAEYLLSLNGTNGVSAYQVAVNNGFIGTESDWLLSLKGTDGVSAYQVAVNNGFVGTESQWLASLKGADGSTYNTGIVTADFGAGAMTVSTVVTGVNSVTASSIVIPKIRIEATPEHSTCDLLIDPIRLDVKDFIAGVGFTIVATMENARANGSYKINWLLLE